MCGETIVEQEVIPAGHTEEAVEGKAATCEEAGLVAHIHCTVCEKNFDAEGNELDKVVIEALGHTEEAVEGKAATCEEAGIVAHIHCEVCEKNFDAEGVELETVVIEALGHTKEAVEGKVATCEEEGLVAHLHCTVCEKNFDAEGNELDKVVIEALGHEYDESVWGYKDADGHAHLCKRCDAHDEIVAHTSRENLPVLEEDVCTVCGYVINQAQVTLESLFTDEVLENKYVLNMTQYDVTIDLYAVKDNERVYFVANYYTKTPDTAGGWWEQDNFELRLNTPSGFVLNGKPFDPNFFGSDKQWFISVNNESNFEYFIISQPVDSDREGYKVIEFVAYLSFAKLGIEADTPLGFTIGSNPGGKGFIGSENWESGDLAKLKKITTKGILDYCLPENCAHVYGDYVTTTPATCKEDGIKEAKCPYCQHVDQVVIPATGDHVYTLKEVKTPSTCSINGVGLGICGCGHEGEFELEKDLTNHGDHWNSQTNVCACGSVVNWNVVDVDRPAFSSLRYTVDTSKDFEFNAIMTTEHNAHSSEWGHNFTAEIFALGPDWLNGGWSYRTDWCGWGTWADKGNPTYTDVNTGLWHEKYFEASANMDIVYNLKYDAASGKFTITMTYHSNVEPYSQEDKHLTYTCYISYRGLACVGFGAEKAKVTFKYLSYTQGTEVFGPLLDGKMDDAHWTEEVLSKPLSHSFVNVEQNLDVKVDLYATRDEEGVYLFGKYQTKELHTTGDWWQQDNIELRFVANGVILNNYNNDPQWYVSTSSKNFIDKVVVSSAVLNEETGYYEISFEFYVSYRRLGIDANTRLGVAYGINPGGKQFSATPNFGSTNIDQIGEITVNGIL